MSDRKFTIDGKNDWQGAYGASSRPAEMIAQTQREWEKMWRRMNGKQVPMPATPDLPVGAAAIGIFKGPINTGGYSVEIVDIYEDDGKLNVDWCEHEPPRGAVTTMAMTAPYHVRLIEDKDMEIVFNKVAPGAKPRRRADNNNVKAEPEPKPDRRVIDKEIIDRIRRRRGPKLG